MKFAQLMNQYLDRHAYKLRDRKTQEGRVKGLVSYFGEMELEDVNSEIISQFQIASVKVRSVATTNRYCTVLRKALNLGWEWNYINKVPRIHFEPEHNWRDRWLSREEEETLMLALVLDSI